MSTRRQVIQSAASHIGYVEQRTTKYPHGNVTVFWAQMEAVLNLHQDALQGQPWCAAFVNSVLVDNGIRGLLDGPALPFYTPSMEHWAKDTGRWRDSIDLKPGDVLIFTESKTIHTGFLEKQVDANTVQTIEGNTSPGNSGSQANGGGVYRRRRKRSWVRGGIDMSDFYDGHDDITVTGRLDVTTVSELQSWLNTERAAAAMRGRSVRAWPVLTVDGEMGPQTTKALQCLLVVEPDGEFGPKSARALEVLLEAPETTIPGWYPGLIRALQRYLIQRKG